MKRLYFIPLLMAVLYMTGYGINTVTEGAYCPKGTPVIVRLLPFGITARCRDVACRVFV